MLIIGAKGFAKELLDIFHEKEELNNLTFYDDVSIDLPEMLFNQFNILKELDKAQWYLNHVDKRFTLGLGNPALRRKMYQKFDALGGELTSTVSLGATIGNYNVSVAEGCNVLNGAVISNSVNIGIGCIIYYNTIITHDCTIGDYVELSPGAKVLGRARVGSFSQIGANATILPDIEIGENVIVGAGAVVTKDLPDNCLVAGVPAVIKRELPPLILSTP